MFLDFNCDKVSKKIFSSSNLGLKKSTNKLFVYNKHQRFLVFSQFFETKCKTKLNTLDGLDAPYRSPDLIIYYILRPIGPREIFIDINDKFCLLLTLGFFV